MLQTTSKPSMNEPHDQDPFNNSSYGTLVDSPYKLVSLPVLDVLDFNERIIRGYEDGSAEKGLPADLSLARSLVPAGTATLRDFSNIAPEIPLYIPENCTGCMDCVTQCLTRRSSAKCSPRPSSRSGWRRSPKRLTERCSALSGLEPRSTSTHPKRRGCPGGCSTSSSTPASAKGAPSASRCAMTTP